MPSATVVICTYNRPDMLPRAVRTARDQVLQTGFSAEILVVDNSRDANAHAGVEALMTEPGALPLRYISMPRPNISHARNAGVAGSAGDYVVFLDDDEWCAPGWLGAMLTTAETTGADLVFGPVLPVFPDGLPQWDSTGRSLERRMALPDGSFIGIHHDTSISGMWIGTNNSLFRRRTCLDEAAPFDPALGLVGGEDSDIFLRLWQRGRKLAWCAEGVVWEDIPASRITMTYRRKRAFITGQLFAAITIRRAPQRLITIAWVTVKGVVQVSLVAAQWCIRRALGKTSAQATELKLYMVVGKLFWWNLALEPN